MGFGLVGDGMGGYACGELASDWVKATVEKAVANHEDSRVAITSAHTVLKNVAAEDPAQQVTGDRARNNTQFGNAGGENV